MRKTYRELQQSQWLSRQDMEQLQNRKLRRMVRLAYEHVPYYRHALQQAGLTPDDIQTVHDLVKLPLLTKDDVRENLYFDLLSANHDKRKILKITTSGSTGEPFVCFADQHQLEIRWATTLRSLEWTGYSFGDRQARLWHQTLGMSWLQIVREHVDAWFCRRLFIPVFELSDESMRRFVSKLSRFRPVLIDGYAEALNLLAAYLRSHAFICLG